MNTPPKSKFVPPSGWRRDPITDELIQVGRKPKIQYRYAFSLRDSNFEDVIPRVKTLWKFALDLEREIRPKAFALAASEGLALEKFDLLLAAGQIGMKHRPTTFRDFYTSALSVGLHPQKMLGELQDVVECSRGYFMVEKYLESYQNLVANCSIIYLYAGATFNE